MRYFMLKFIVKIIRNLPKNILVILMMTSIFCPDAHIFKQLFFPQTAHNAIHATLTCTMGRPQFAAYDPIFWLHHVFVDKVINTEG